MKVVFYKAYKAYSSSGIKETFLLFPNYKKDENSDLCFAMFDRSNYDSEDPIEFNTVCAEYILSNCLPIDNKEEYLHLVDNLSLYPVFDSAVFISL